jgi:hypothetical protein
VLFTGKVLPTPNTCRKNFHQIPSRANNIIVAITDDTDKSPEAGFDIAADSNLTTFGSASYLSDSHIGDFGSFIPNQTTHFTRRDDARVYYHEIFAANSNCSNWVKWATWERIG